MLLEPALITAKVTGILEKLGVMYLGFWKFKEEISTLVICGDGRRN